MPISGRLVHAGRARLWQNSAPEADCTSMLGALKYIWTASTGYHLRPWKSPYVRWRMETFFGPQSAELSAGQFFSLLWRERARMRRFLAWVEERQSGVAGKRSS